MRNILWLAPLALPLVLAACNDPGFRGVTGVRETDAAGAAGCAYVTDIRGTPSVYGPVLGAQGVSYTRNKVLEDARAAGANTVVFDPVSPGAEVYVLTARAYRC